MVFHGLLLWSYTFLRWYSMVCGYGSIQVYNGILESVAMDLFIFAMVSYGQWLWVYTFLRWYSMVCAYVAMHFYDGIRWSVAIHVYDGMLCS